MSFMDRFARLDSSLQRGLDNGFALVFGGRVVPSEVEELIKQEAQDNLVSTEDRQLLAPNVFVVGVSTKDLNNLEGSTPSLPDDLVDRLSRFGRNQGWFLAGPVVVSIAEESGLHTGQLRVASYVDSDPEEVTGFDALETEDPATSRQYVSPASERAEKPAPTSAPVVPPTPAKDSMDTEAQDAASAVSLLLQDGSSRTYHLREGSNIIGRSTEADLRLPDTGVSRQHAEITWDGSDAVLVDLESTNGTNVNDNPVENWLLADGDVITVGHSHIEVRITDRSAAQR